MEKGVKRVKPKKDANKGITMDIKIHIPDKKTDLALRKMDLLERKLDQQYQSIVERNGYDKKSFVRELSDLQRSFLSSLDKMISSNMEIVRGINDGNINRIKNDFNSKIRVIRRTNDTRGLKEFSNQITKLEDAIKKISNRNSSVKVVKVDNPLNDKLVNSLSSSFKRIEELLRANRPRVFPSPS